MNIYVPTDLINKDCYVIENGLIKVFNTIDNSENNATNIVYNVLPFQDYQSYITYESYSNDVLCSSDSFTDNFVYRVDFPKILFMFVIFFFIIIYIPYKIIYKMLGKWGRI